MAFTDNKITFDAIDATEEPISKKKSKFIGHLIWAIDLAIVYET